MRKKPRYSDGKAVKLDETVVLNDYIIAETKRMSGITLSERVGRVDSIWNDGEIVAVAIEGHLIAVDPINLDKIKNEEEG